MPNGLCVYTVCGLIAAHDFHIDCVYFFRTLDPKLQKALHEYLEARGVNDELAIFLHAYMVNKDRTELLKWLENVKSFVEL